MKSTVGILLATLTAILGLVGVLMDAVGKLPPEFPIPSWVMTAILFVGIVIGGLGWQEQLMEGKAAIIELIKKFIFHDSFRKLALALLVTLAREVLGIANIPGGVESAAQIFLAVYAVIFVVDGKASFKVYLLAHKSGVNL